MGGKQNSSTFKVFQGAYEPWYLSWHRCALDEEKNGYVARDKLLYAL